MPLVPLVGSAPHHSITVSPAVVAVGFREAGREQLEAQNLPPWNEEIIKITVKSPFPRETEAHVRDLTNHFTVVLRQE